MKHYCRFCGKELEPRKWERGPKAQRKYCDHVCHSNGTKATGIARFLARVKRVSDTNACWEWSGKWKGYGYPMVTCRAIQHNPMPVHQAAFYAAFGYKPSVGMVCHTCDNPLCCNPNHLYHGTAKSNIRDAIERHRFKFPKPRFGENHHMTKITAEQVIAIRTVYPLVPNGRKTEYAAQFGMHRDSVKRIVNGGTWKHLL